MHYQRIIKFCNDPYQCIMLRYMNCVEYLKVASTSSTSPETDQVKRYVQFPQLPLEEIGLNKVLKQPNNDISSL